MAQTPRTWWKLDSAMGGPLDDEGAPGRWAGSVKAKGPPFDSHLGGWMRNYIKRQLARPICGGDSDDSDRPVSDRLPPGKNFGIALC